jgi:steroid 5-alpha reductase family enzyme
MTEPDLSQHQKTLPQAPKRPVTSLQCYLTYIVSTIIGIVCWVWLLHAYPENNPFTQGLIVTTVCTFVVWIFSMINNNSSLYDPYWVIAPPFFVLGIIATADNGFAGWHMRDTLILLCFVAWAARYHIVWFWEGWTKGLEIEDWRYEAMRSAPLPYWLNSFIGMHYFPTYLVYYAFAPAALVLMMEPASQPGLNIWDVLGVVGAFSAAAIQWFADTQNAAFRESEEYRNGGAIRTGLWAYSRHPNYFGEVLFWLSMIPFAIAAGLFEAHTALILSGPIAMAIFFRFSSWLMDVRSLERRPGYQVLMDEVSAMVPWFPKKTGKSS